MKNQIEKINIKERVGEIPFPGSFSSPSELCRELAEIENKAKEDGYTNITLGIEVYDGDLFTLPFKILAVYGSRLETDEEFNNRKKATYNIWTHDRESFIRQANFWASDVGQERLKILNSPSIIHEEIELSEEGAKILDDILADPNCLKGRAVGVKSRCVECERPHPIEMAAAEIHKNYKGEKWFNTIGTNPPQNDTLIIYTNNKKLKPLFDNYKGFKVKWKHMGKITPL